MGDIKYKAPVSNNYLKDNSDRTSLIKDRVLPNLKEKAYGASGALIGGALGAGLGIAGRKATRTIIKKTMSPEVTSFIKKNLSEGLAKNHKMYADSKKFKKYTKTPMKVLFSDEMANTRSLIAAGTSGLAGAAVGKRTGEVMGNTSRLRDMYRGQFGVEPTENEMFESARLNPKNMIDRSLYKYFYTPEAMTKSTFRNTRQMNNSQFALDPRETRNNMQGHHSPMYQQKGNFKMASDNLCALEKVAIKVEQINKIKDAVKGAEKYVNSAAKKAPLIGAASTGLALTGPAYLASKAAIDNDSKNRKLKKGLMQGSIIGAGAITGSAIGKNVGALSKSLYGKVKDPEEVIKKGVKTYASLFKKSSDDYKYEMEKVAKKEKFNQAIARRMSTSKMNDKDFETFAERMNKTYGASTFYERNNDPSSSYALTDDALKKINPKVKELMSIPNLKKGHKNFVRSLPLEEVMVHETGHILDKNIGKTSKRIGAYGLASTASSVTGNIGSKIISNPYGSAAAAVAGVGGGTILQDLKGRTVEKREDDANKFVKRYYTEKFKDANKADEFIKNKSAIPAARKTYKDSRVMGTASHAVAYGLPAAYTVTRKFLDR